MMRWGKHSGGARRGFVMITMLVCLVVLLAFLGLAVDAGYLEWVKTRLQTAADAAALGGAEEVRMNGSAGVGTAARADAALNGFTDGLKSVSVTVNNPPAVGYSTGNGTGVEVTVAQQVGTFFMRLVGTDRVGLQARAVARLGSGTSCLYVLDPAASGAFIASGGVNVEIACGVMVDSANATAFQVTGGSTVTAGSIAVAGGSSVNGRSTVKPAPVTGVTPAPDPLAYVSAPSVGGCNFTNTSVGNGQTKTLPPGVYCNGITLGGGARITFSPPGTYILKGGGLNISNGVTVTGSGVTFYNTAGGGFSYQPVAIGGGAVVNLSAPTTGPLAGILMFQDRSIVSSAINTVDNGATAALNGSLYFPTAALSYSGGTNAIGTYSIIVAKTITFSGGCKMNNDYSSLPDGSPVKGNAILSE